MKEKKNFFFFKGQIQNMKIFSLFYIQRYPLIFRKREIEILFRLHSLKSLYFLCALPFSLTQEKIQTLKNE